MLELKVGDVLYSKSALLNEKIETVTVVKITKDSFSRPNYDLSNGVSIWNSSYHNYVKASDFNLEKFFMALKDFKENILPYLKKEEEKPHEPNELSLNALQCCLNIFEQFSIYTDTIMRNSSIYNDIKEISEFSKSWRMSSLSC
jgi:hypothetical protein